MKLNLTRVIIGLYLCIGSPASAQIFSVSPNQVEISVAPGFNHSAVDVIVVTNIGGLNLADMVVTSDSAWATPSVNVAASKIVLQFASANLVNSIYTATITATLAGQSNSFFVKAYVSQLNIFKLKDDPLRSRTYGIQQNGVGLGSVVVLDPVTTNYLANVTVGHKPCDFAESVDGQELFVINSVDATIAVIDLNSFKIKETLILPSYDNWGPADTTANIAVGPANILYYLDGNWAPTLRVLNRSSMQVLQTVYTQGAGGDGFGDIGLTSDRSVLYGWMQYGWSAGSANSYVTRFTVAANGLLSYTDNGPSQYSSNFARDPLETPVLITSDNQTVFIKGFALGTNSASNIKYTFPTPVYSITPRGEVAATATAVYQTETGIKLADLPVSAPVQTISSDYARLIYFDSGAHLIKVLNLPNLVGPGILNQTVIPADGAITLPPPRLEWSAMPGVDRYRVYLGTASSAVTSADTNSPVYLGTVTAPYVQLATALNPGVTYYWRVDAVSPFDITLGSLHQFTVSSIACQPTQIDVATVRGHRDFTTSLTLTSAAPGLTWQADANQSWISFVQTNGVTPATLLVRLDASQLPSGAHQGTITIRSGTNTLFALPVKLRVDTMNLTVMKSAPVSVFSYAISEDTTTTPTRAYLLEINTVTETISRVAAVGSSATDLAIHPGDNRIYVPNWTVGNLLAVDLNTFQTVRSYAFSPFGGMGYSENDIYRVSAAGPGRLVWEEQDQWIDINLFDTVAGTNLASAFVREGGGECSPNNRRYYYHGENNSSGAALLKFDLLGDVFTSLASVRVATYSYYGSRVVIVSDDGNRVFWNGGVFDADLNVVWTISDQIYATSADGRYAFADTEVFDTVQHSVITNLAPASTVKTFNAVTSKLISRGSNGIAFYRMSSPGTTTPAEGAIVPSPGALTWQALPVTSNYRVYLGTSRDAVLAADTTSPLYLGQVATTNFTLNPLAAGTYYWRVDAVTPYGTVVGDIHSFTVSPVSPSLQEINEITFLDRPATVSLTLTSLVAGTTWQATPSAPWISLNQTSGVTPISLQITLQPTNVAPAVRSGEIILSSGGSALFNVPVQLTVEALALTQIKSDHNSDKAYAISENAATSPPKAYLLEINTTTESIERVVGVGATVTDLAIHNGDNRIYVPNWQTGMLLGIDKTAFQVVKSYTFSPSSAGGGDVYRVAAGAPGRLVVEEQDQWIDISIFDTSAGTKLANAFVREGGGAFGGNGRYYYHGDNNSSGAEIHKFDNVGDAFTELAHLRVSSWSYYGSRTVVVSQDGSRVFWNGSMFDADLAEQWSMTDEVYSCSADGRYACSQTKIYDTVQKSAVLGSPANTTVTAFNSSSQKLIAQVGGKLGFFAITTPLTLSSPLLSTGAVASTSIQLAWQDRSLEDTFSLQMRPVGNANWTDLAPISRNVTQYSVTGLLPETSYQFRIKSDAATVSSPWSDVLTVTTPAIPPTTPTLNNPSATTTSVTLTWSNPSFETSILLERSVNPSSGWSLLANLAADVITFTDTNVVSLTNYYYRVKAQNAAGDSAYSAIRNIIVPAPQPPVAPAGLLAKPLSSSTVHITWSDVATETGFRLERRTETPNSWVVVALLATNATSFIDTNLVLGLQYWYRVLAVNAAGNSPYSNEDDATPVNIVNLLADDFDPGYDPLVWTSIASGVATNGGQGFHGSKALYFGANGPRSATTIPVNVSAGGSIDFLLRAGNGPVDGAALWDNSENGESVVLEYSKDNGANWTLIQTLNTTYPALSNWTSFSVVIPGGAFGAATQFRWRQLASSGLAFDCWALEDIAIVAAAPSPPATVPFVISSPSSATSIAIYWAGSGGASSYVLERKNGTAPWSPIATTSFAETYYTDQGLQPSTAYSYRIQAINAGGVSDYSLPTTSYTWSQWQDWAYNSYGTPESPTREAMTTPGPDGTLPLLRYAFNLDAFEPIHPLQISPPAGCPAIWINPANHRLTVEFVRRKATTSPGISYQVQFSSDLEIWSTASTPVTNTPIDSIWERVRYEDAATAPPTFRFGRVAVSPQ